LLNPTHRKPTHTMILQQILFLSILFYREILLAWAQELYLADALAHASGHLLVRLKDLLDFTPIEAACAHYRHQQGAGCPPTYAVGLLVRATLVGWLYGLSLRQLEERLHSDLVARWFVGCPAGGTLPDHTTLGRFELWLMQNHTDLYFETVLHQVDQAFPQEHRQVQIGDTYVMLAWAAEESLVGRLRHVCRRLMMELADSLPGKFESHTQGFDWLVLFGPKPEKYVDRLDKSARAQRLERTALAALEFRRRVGQLLEPYASGQYCLLRGWCSYLDKILADEMQIEYDPQGRPLKAVELPSHKKGEFRLVSATDPEASYRMHGEEEKDIALGYNVQVAATLSGFVRETKAYTGADPDQAGVAALVVEQKERLGSCPPKLIYDKAAGAGKTRAEVEQASDGQTQLVAQQMPYDQRSERFGPYDFTLSEDGQSLSCPAGKVSTTAYPSGNHADGRTFRFFACQCWNDDPPKRMKTADLTRRCPLWEQCRDSRQGPGSMRQVFISDYRQQVLQAEVYNQSETFQREMKQRPRIERVVFELTHYCGARQCRRRGLLAADYQAKMCATVYNLKLWVRKLSRSTPRQAALPLAG